MNGKGIGTMSLLLGLFVVVLIGAVWTGFIDLSSFTASVTQPQLAGATCSDPTVQPTVQFVATDAINKNTSRQATTDVNFYRGTSENTLYFSEQNILSTDSTMGVAPNDFWTAYLTGTNNTTYYGQVIKSSDTNPVTGQPYGLGQCSNTALNVPVSMKTVGSLTLAFHNTDDGATNGSGDAQAVGSGATVTMNIDYEEATADAFWHTSDSPLPPIAVIDLNDGTWDTTGIEIIGAGATSTGVPNGHTDTDANRNFSMAFALNGIGEISDFDNVTGLRLKVTADSGVNPATTGDPDGLRVSIYTAQLVQDISGNWVWAYRNPDTGAQLIAPSSTILYVS